MAVKQIQTKQAPRDARQYLSDLEELLKRNTGTGTHIGADVSSNTPMYIPGKVFNPTGLGQSAPSISQFGNGMTQPLPVERNIQQLDIPQQGGQVLGATDFLNQLEQTYNQVQPQAQGMDQSNPGAMATAVQQTADGGTLFTDGIIYYSDGTFRAGDGNAQPIASDVSGGTQYSDGSVRMSYESVGLPQQSIPGGLSGLIQGIFGQDRTITQAYGNYNPQLEPGSGYNLGTDIRTRDLLGSQRQYKLPVGATVVQVLQDDGTQWGTQSGHQGYGNSVLLRLPSGEMLRFSHMSQMANLQEGQRVEAGQVFGEAGQTGNTSGEHLDLEYYNQGGQLSDPSQFSGFTNPQSLLQPKMFSSVDDPQPVQAPQPQQINQSFEQPQQQIPTPTTDALSAVTQAPQNVFNTAKEAIPTVDEIKQLNPIQGEFGVSEGLITPEAKQARVQSLSQQPDIYNPFRQLAGNITERIGDTLGVPEGGLSESIAGGQTKRTGQAFANEIGSDPQAPVPGIRQNIKDIGGEIKSAGQDALGQAGQGVKSLGQAGISALENVFTPKQEVEKRAVGDVAGTAEQPGQAGQFSSVMDTASSLANVPKNDIRDPFFKYGGSETYQKFLKPNAQDLQGGALTLDLFNNDFFKDIGNISNVFGGSKDIGAATEKFIDFEREKYKPMDRINFEEGYDRGEVENYNRQVDEYNNSINKYYGDVRSSTAGAKSAYLPGATPSAKNIFANSTPQINMSRSVPQMSVARPQMSLAKPSTPSANISRPNMSIAKPNMSVNRPSQNISRPSSPSRPAQQSNRPGSSAPQMSVARKPAPRVSAPRRPSAPQQSNRVGSSAPQQSTAVRRQSRPAPKKRNVFSRASSYLRNIFRR